MLGGQARDVRCWPDRGKSPGVCIVGSYFLLIQGMHGGKQGVCIVGKEVAKQHSLLICGAKKSVYAWRELGSRQEGSC